MTDEGFVYWNPMFFKEVWTRCESWCSLRDPDPHQPDYGSYRCRRRAGHYDLHTAKDAYGERLEWTDKLTRFEDEA